ncbi:npp1 domain protein [Diplodia corticola]|uniref:Npp1 domain protein n=1 Tax=Diplodia corticola TaxID=236234 RepID=A0A1J9QT32_9PEZI|nr:npp1 domain protein [Diplodia corticola]OJD31600.1 npp1 domain protein [Diplodia corticola]
MSLSIRHGLVCLLAAGAGVSGVGAAAIHHRRDAIDHDAVVGFPETVPAGAVGELYEKFKPFLKVESGCVPFPAVDAQGNTNAGLNPSGTSTGDCDSSPGQIYVRGGTPANANATSSSSTTPSYAIMYSWYMPKDSPSTGLGHRHDWEGVVVWLGGDPSSPATAQLLGVAASGHGGYETRTDAPVDEDGTRTRPLIRYYNVFPVNHQTGFTSEVGGEQPMVAWESLPDAARRALQEADFGSGNVPFKDGNFEENLAKAALS